jgi:hypothetical protein
MGRTDGPSVVRFADSFRRFRTVQRLRGNVQEEDVKFTKNKDGKPGDVLGISNLGGPKLPHPPSDGSTARGIDVRDERKRHWGNEDVPQSDGATGIDMGGGGEGTQMAAESLERTNADEA